MLSFDVKIEQLCYHQSISNVNQYEKSKLVVLPSSILEKLYNELDNQISYPICFTIKSDKIIRDLYVSVLEFSSPEDICYMPTTLMNEFWLDSTDNVILEYVSPPLCSKIILQPDKDDFFSLTNNKELLEEAISKYYKILTMNDVITFDHNGEEHNIYISHIEPNDVVITHETDIDLEYVESNETQTKNRLEELKLKRLLEKQLKEMEEEEKEKKRIKELNESKQRDKDKEIAQKNSFLKELHEARLKRR